MNAPVPHHEPSDETLDEIATTWLCEREDGFTPERERAFAAWRAENPRHEAAVRRVEAMFALLGELPEVRASLETRIAREDVAPAEAKTTSGRIVRFPGLAWAASLAAALVIGWFLWPKVSEPRLEPVRYVTDGETQRRIGLSDGSLILLNSASEVVVAFDERERRVFLPAGEAHFDVAHDASRPFFVTAGGVSVRAVGTAFNVKVAKDAIDVLVVEGKVEVTRQDEPVAAQAERPLIVAGEQAHVSRAERAAVPKVEKVTTESIRERLAWQGPMIPFVDLPLRDLVIQFNRRNTLQLVLGDPELGERKIGGMIALDQVEAFVRMLEYGGDITAERHAGDEIVLRRAR